MQCGARVSRLVVVVTERSARSEPSGPRPSRTCLRASDHTTENTMARGTVDQERKRECDTRDGVEMYREGTKYKSAGVEPLAVT